MELTEQDTTDQSQDTTEDIPRLKVAEAGHKMSIGENSGTEREDQWQEAHSSLDRIVTPCKLEVQGYVVDGNESGSVNSRGANKEEDCIEIAQELAREDASADAGEDCHALLDAKHDKQDA